jgi:hypothetical protein
MYENLPPYDKHVSLPVDDVRARGCQWLINGIHCKKPCAPFLFLCHEHKDIPDFPRPSIHSSTTCRKRI